MMRWALHAGIVAAVLIVGSSPALADEALEEMLESAGSADFTASGIVACTWGEDSAAASYEVSRHGGMVMVSGGGMDLMLGGGVVATRSGTDWYGLGMDAWSDWILSDRYSLDQPSEVLRLGRPAREMLVHELAEPRARVIVDAETGVPLLVEILDGGGAVYRMAALVDFTPAEAAPAAATVPGMDGMTQRRSIGGRASPGELPPTAAWYRLVDTYSGPADTVHAFYTDGLFSFSVFESRRGPTPEAFRDATAFAVAGETYRRIVAPSQVWVQWHAPDRTYVLVGDLPPDHVEDVLSDLPEPGERSILVRLWRRLFG